MQSFTAYDITQKNGETTHYYEGGSKNGIPLIFIHGWPDIAETWKHQLLHLSAGSKYRVIAPDMRGYGLSSAPANKRAYALEALVAELVEFAEKLNIEKAVWIGHDWGCGVVNALAAHHPELFLGLVLLAVPYRSIELGLNYIVNLVNRDIYPKDEYEWGPWEYMRYYELHPEESVKSFEGHIETITKALYSKHDPSKWGKPAVTSRTLRDGGWFGGHPEKIPDIPLEYTILDESLLENLLKSHKKHGFFPPTAYYLNHDVNEEYAKSEKNGGILEFPVLFIDAKHDSVCSPSVAPKLAENQQKFVKNLTYATIESGHWVQLEKPKETNEVLEKWLGERF
ncbi:alpha/beta-hydrolase [Cucurbitaria berberidis CBS 394.84]|uniref:Alpha/beta-hydrolase n=1 Tax=Cucurbitaria berberidis CBS 394.84 TaxID=1168544 RepID=A0A9P4GGM5_9PLEO|nr:alpha/beta-hydrolase [Cucurbitaria berberidis CBS 394.84]KAF1845205.1 alpha/beta-hydrolase [Cucurbitaria berberidis CBS 394.84]